jgi:hypothetical protein
MMHPTMKYLLLLPLLTLFSCRHLSNGVVVEKSYEPERTYMMFIPMRVGKTTTLLPVVMYDGADYIITIRGEYEGETLEETYYVDSRRYDTVKTGDLFCVDKSCAEDDYNNQRAAKP